MSVPRLKRLLFAAVMCERGLSSAKCPGEQAGVPDLTWSYASALSALLARHKAIAACRRKGSGKGEAVGSFATVSHGFSTTWQLSCHAGCPSKFVPGIVSDFQLRLCGAVQGARQTIDSSKVGSCTVMRNVRKSKR